MSQHGEPWKFNATFEDGWVRDSRSYRLLERGLHGNESHAKRAVDCVNALAGVRDVGKVAALLAGLRDMGTDIERYQTVLDALVEVANELE